MADTARADADMLGLAGAPAIRMLPLLVAAMAFLAAIALGGAVAAATLADRWRGGAAASLTVQVPQPGQPAATGNGTRLDQAVAMVRGEPGVAAARALSDGELADLLRPWLGAGAEQMQLPLPGVIAVTLAPDAAADPDAMASRLQAVAPGARAEGHGIWLQRLSRLAASLRACAWAVTLVVALVAAAVVAMATRAGIAARHEAIEIVHGLGATDSAIAARFARLAAGRAILGAILGAALALPLLLGLARLAAPFMTAPLAAPPLAAADVSAPVAALLGWLSVLPTPLWAALPALPVAAGAIGFCTAQATVRAWLRRLP